MQINTYTPSFGMAIHSSKSAKNVLRNRIKRESEIAKLNDLIDRQMSNDRVEIKLLTDPQGKRLIANISDVKNFTDTGDVITESKFASKLLSPVLFIKKISKLADRKVANIPSPEIVQKLDKVLNKI
ncbi:hypothetical protein IJZ97_06710 [bacterium]|nr:hypothetical protein [bacterium]